MPGEMAAAEKRTEHAELAQTIAACCFSAVRDQGQEGLVGSGELEPLARERCIEDAHR